MAENLRDFVVGLGFELDESAQRRFTTALEGATLRAKLLGDALEFDGALDRFERRRRRRPISRSCSIRSQRVGSSVGASEPSSSPSASSAELRKAPTEASKSFGRNIRDQSRLRMPH